MFPCQKLPSTLQASVAQGYFTETAPHMDQLTEFKSDSCTCVFFTTDRNFFCDQTPANRFSEEEVSGKNDHGIFRIIFEKIISKSVKNSKSQIWKKKFRKVFIENHIENRKFRNLIFDVQMIFNGKFSNIFSDFLDFLSIFCSNLTFGFFYRFSKKNIK